MTVRQVLSRTGEAELEVLRVALGERDRPGELARPAGSLSSQALSVLTIWAFARPVPNRRQAPTVATRRRIRMFPDFRELTRSLTGPDVLSKATQRDPLMRGWRSVGKTGLGTGSGPHEVRVASRNLYWRASREDLAPDR